MIMQVLVFNFVPELNVLELLPVNPMMFYMSITINANVLANKKVMSTIRGGICISGLHVMVFILKIQA